MHPILLGVGGTIYAEHILEQSKQLGLDHQRAMKLAQQLHAHSFHYAQKLVSTRRAIENKHTSHIQHDPYTKSGGAQLSCMVALPTKYLWRAWDAHCTRCPGPGTLQLAFKLLPLFNNLRFYSP
eukprot:scaffold198403_cov17-Tisochrysis_lutea.AAC.1